MRPTAILLPLAGATLLASAIAPAAAGAVSPAAVRPVATDPGVTWQGQVISLDRIGRKPVAMPTRVTGSILSPVPRVVILQRKDGATWKELSRVTVAPTRPCPTCAAQPTRFGFGIHDSRTGRWQLRAVARVDAATNRYIFSGGRWVKWVPAVSAVVQPVTAAQLGRSYRRGCPVGPSSLRRLVVTYRGFDNQYRRGELFVHHSVTGDLTAVFDRAVRKGFRIQGMVNVDRYAANDPASMRAGNTSAFNCRKVIGNPYRLSRHSWGDAIDINPVQNPYQDATGRWWPENSRSYRDRSPRRMGMHSRQSSVPVAMRRVGWHWGARWSRPDYHHFSRTGQ